MSDQWGQGQTQNAYSETVAYQQPGNAPARSRRSLLIGGGAALVLAVATVAFFVAKGSGSTEVRTASSSTTTTADGQSPTNSCAAWTNEQTAILNQGSDNSIGMVVALTQDEKDIQTIADGAQVGTLKIQLQKLVTDYATLADYFKANPDITGDSTVPAQYALIQETMLTDFSAVDTACGLPAPDSTDFGS